MGKNSDLISIVSYLPKSIQIDFSDLIPELVLLKMNIGESFALGTRLVTMSRISKYSGKNDYIVLTAKLDISGQSKQLFIWKIGNQYHLHGTSGQTKKHDWVHNLLRDIEGLLVCDVLNSNNQFHEFSDAYKIYKR